VLVHERRHVTGLRVALGRVDPRESLGDWLSNGTWRRSCAFDEFRPRGSRKHLATPDCLPVSYSGQTMPPSLAL
jgi:hypothetical protein